MTRVHGRVVAMGAALLLVILLGTTASGYWTASGWGTGTTPTATAQNVVLSAATPTTKLYPGGSADVAVTVTNPNGFPLRLTSLARDTSQGASGFGVDPEHAALGCTGGSLVYTTQNNGGAGWTLAANASVTLNLGGALSMDVGAHNACQGASFIAYLKVGP